MSTDTNKALVERFDAILNTADLGQLDELCSPDMVNHSLAPSRAPGLAGTRQWLASEGRKFESFRWRELFVVAEGDLAVQFGVRGGHWPGGAFRGFGVPAGPYHRDTAFMYRGPHLRRLPPSSGRLAVATLTPGPCGRWRPR